MQAGKPGSVPLQQMLLGPYHLSCPDFAIGVNQPTHPARP